MKNLSGNNKNALAIAASVVMAVGTFLPFVKASFLGMSQSLVLTSTFFGWIILILAGIGLIAGYINSGWMMLISGGLSFATALAGYTSIMNSDTGDEFTNMFVNSIVQRDAGFYVIVSGAALLILANFFRDKDITKAFQK